MRPTPRVTTPLSMENIIMYFMVEIFTEIMSPWRWTSLKMGIAKLSMLAERQLNYLMNPKLNEMLPPFVNLGQPGLNLGMQGVQFTAVSTVC